MLLFWCCQGIPGTAAFKRAWGLTLLACLCDAVICIKYERLFYSAKCSNSWRGGKKNTASPATLLVPAVQDTLSYWHVSLLW